MSKNKNTYPEIHRKYIYIQQITLGVLFGLVVVTFILSFFFVSHKTFDFWFYLICSEMASMVIFNISLYFYYIYYFKKILKTELPFWLVPDQSIVIHDMINKDQKKI